jgi:hypothetical protein
LPRVPRPRAARARRRCPRAVGSCAAWKLSEKENAIAHAGIVQEFRVVEARTEPIKVGWQIIERIEDHRHVGRGEILRHDPGFGAARNHGFHAMRFRVAHDLTDIGGTFDEENDAPAGEVAFEHRTALGQEQGAIARRRRLAHLADRLVEEHVLRGAAAAGSIVSGAAPVHEE